MSATPTAALLVAGAVVGYVVAFAMRSLLAHLVAGLVTAFVVTCFVLARTSLDGVEVTRAVRPTATDGEDFDVHYTVTNASRARRSLVEVSSHFYGALSAPGHATALALDVRPGKLANVVSTLPDLRRGDFVLAPPIVASGDPFGLFGARREVSEEECPSERVTVFPRAFPLDAFSVESDLSWSFSGLEPTNRPGSSGDFLGTREYRPGDSVRAIHWPLSARMGELIIKEFERTSATEVSIVLDLDGRAVWGVGRDSTIEYAVRIAASVADFALRRGNAVQVLGHGSRPVRIASGKGTFHQQAIMRFLATVQPTGSVPFDVVINQLAPQIHEGGSAVIIFPSHRLQLERVAPALEMLWARRVRVTAVVMDAESFDPRAATPRAAAPGAGAGSVGQAAAYLASRRATVYSVSRGGDLGRQLSVPL